MKKVLYLFLPLAFVSCDETEQTTDDKAVDKKGSVVISYEQKELPGDFYHDPSVIVTTNCEYYYGGILAKKITHYDTVPSLGKEVKEFENEDSSWFAAMPNKYKFYVTVK